MSATTAPRYTTKGFAMTDLNDSQSAVLKVFEAEGRHLTDMELGYAYRLVHGGLDQSWSGLRTRRKELTDMGFLVVKSVDERVSGGRRRKVNRYGIAPNPFPKTA